MAEQLPMVHAVRIHFPTDNSKSLLTKFYVLSGLLLTSFIQPTWPRFYGSPSPSCTIVLFHRVLSFSLLFLMVSSLGKLQPCLCHVSSPQLLAAGIFICQSELIGGGVPQATCRLQILEAIP